MRLATIFALVALVATTADARPPPRFDRFNSRTTPGRSWRGLADSPPYAFFEFAPASGAGMGAACACAAVTGAKGEVITFTRASSAWCTASDYSLVSCSNNLPRVMPGRPGAPLGLYSEQSATNLVVHNSDLSQAAWTKSANMSCTKTATGPDGVANSASRCTTSAATQTVTQATVRASAANSTTAYVRRQTGTGVVEVLDASGTYQAITSSLTTDWKRVACRDVEGCMGGRCIVVPTLCATSTNPSVGFRVQTSGDAIDVALVQSESGLRPTSPITTAAAAASRVEDSAYTDIAVTAGSLRLGIVGTSHNNNEYGLMLSNGAAAPFVTLYSAVPFADFTNNVGCLASTGPSTAVATGLPAGGVAQYSCAFTAGANTACSDGRCDSSGTGVAPSTTRIYLGGAWTGATDKFHGVLSGVCVDPSATTCLTTSVSPASTHIAWLGDSITNGSTTSHPTYPTAELYRLNSQNSSKQVANYGYLGYGLDNGRDVWNTIKTKPFGSLVVLLGVNDLRVGTAASVIWPKYQAILDEARGMGWRVTPVKVLCWGAWAEWTAGKQTETDSLNTSIQAWCDSTGSTCVTTSSMCTGNNLSAGYSFGDGLHLNAAGATALATLVAAANP